MTMMDEARRRELAIEIIDLSCVLGDIQTAFEKRLEEAGLEDHPAFGEAVKLLMEACHTDMVSAYASFLTVEDLERVIAPLRDPEYVEITRRLAYVLPEVAQRAMERVQEPVERLFATRA